MSEPRRPARRALPDNRRLLGWLFAGRAVVATATVIAASLVWTRQPDAAFLAVIGVLLALVLTMYGIWVVTRERVNPGPLFLAFQMMADLGLITALIHFFGPESGTAPALFVLLIAMYAVLMPFWTGVLLTALACAVYIADTLRHTGPTLALLLQVLVFLTVFAVVAVLGQRLRVAGAEQRSLETELRRVRLEAEVILRNIHSGVITVESEGTLAYINPTAATLLGFERGPRPGEPVLERVRDKSPELWTALVRGLNSGERIRRGEAIVTSGGKQFPIGLSTTTFRQTPEAGQSVTAVFTDISDSKRVQELHLRAQRLEAVAALSASLAHEIRNPLASIRSSVEQLARSRHAGDDERTLAALIVRESDRLSRLLSEFLDFSRVRSARAEHLDLLAVAQAAIAVVNAHPDRGPKATIQLEGRTTPIEGDEDLLHRSLVNLVLNAVQAAGDEPIDVTITIEMLDAAELTTEMPMGGQAIRLRVIDTGPGIPEEIREHLFEPFVSRRPGGSGLGLAVVQRAVEAHRGVLFVESQEGSGTAFTIYLPAQRAVEVST